MSLFYYFNMKSLTESLFDRDLVTKDAYQYHPKIKYELRSIIEKELEIQGPDANLNIIDVSKITNMSALFKYLDIKNIDISEWDVSNVKDMSSMFSGCFNFMGNGLDKWDVSKVKDMSSMFSSCYHFNCDISNWDIKNVKYMAFMFFNCESFDQDLSSWDIKKAVDAPRKLYNMFHGCNKMKPEQLPSIA